MAQPIPTINGFSLVIHLLIITTKKGVTLFKQMLPDSSTLRRNITPLRKEPLYRVAYLDIRKHSKKKIKLRTDIKKIAKSSDLLVSSNLLSDKDE
jgi:hypothetical protein